MITFLMYEPAVEVEVVAAGSCFLFAERERLFFFLDAEAEVVHRSGALTLAAPRETAPFRKVRRLIRDAASRAYPSRGSLFTYYLHCFKRATNAPYYD
jgi:hypothetical protein